MRIGVFGGSFDPIHLGHLIVAEQCREQAELDQVWFIPSATNPHKTDGAEASDRQRSEMIGLAIGGHPQFIYSAMEIERGGVSYTVDTLTQLSQEYAPNELFLLMGADSLADFETWREPQRICEMAIPLVVGRPGHPPGLQKLAELVDESRFKLFAEFSIESPLVEISSSDLRNRISEERSIRYLVPRSVEKYIENQKLYRTRQ